METEETSEPQPAPRAWQAGLVWTIREEIALGNLVRIMLPGSASPMIVEEARTEEPFVIVSDPKGHRYYIGSMAGVVLLAQPFEGMGDGVYRPHAHWCAMTVDEDEPIAYFSTVDGTRIKKPNREGDP